MVRYSPWMFPFVAIVPLSACSLRPFDVEPCEVGEIIGFRIAPIEGLFSEYEPRPTSIMVRINDDRDDNEAQVWSVDLNYSSTDDSKYKTRPVRRFIVYGQKFAGWELEQSPKSLSKRQSYRIDISDNGHYGTALFEAGKPLPAC